MEADPPGRDRPFRRRLLQNTAAVGLANGWTIVVSLVSLPVLLSGLGAARFGTWALLQTFSAVGGWASLLDFGLGTATTREVAARQATDDRDGTSAAEGASLALHAGLALVAGLAMATVGRFALPEVFRTPGPLRSELGTAILAFSLQVVADLLSGAFQAVLDGYQRVDRSRAVEVLRRGVVAVAASGAAVVTGNLGTTAVAAALASTVGTAVAALTWRRTSVVGRLRVERSMARQLLTSGREVAVLRPLGVIHRTVDRFVVSAVLGPSAVAVFEVATQLANGTDAVLAATSYAVVPGAAHLDARGDRAKLAHLVARGTRYVTSSTWGVGALTAVLAGPAVEVWVGARYHEAAGAVALAVVGLAVVTPAQVGSNVLLGTGGARTILKVAAAAIVVNVAVSIVLVRAVGIDGAFLGTIAGGLVTLPALARAFLDRSGLDVRTFVRTAVVPSIPVGGAALVGSTTVLALPLGPWPTLIGGGAAGSAMALAAALRWTLGPEEREAVRAWRAGR